MHRAGVLDVRRRTSGKNRCFAGSDPAAFMGTMSTLFVPWRRRIRPAPMVATTMTVMFAASVFMPRVALIHD
jgi:hypothetical protein